ncbi:hypothetical protein FA15DRAFT_761387 [Coprinopsis marcescibilis]|uniref:Uncharacterized protein n=1 Tax=Coprinopsis marcescibilis TaxID=230819 RepID=A0A5C3K9K9_COPMA|nr:hypothetical protein FA15DRAFT_761387 [Coprinopsis marcescibilis]
MTPKTSKVWKVGRGRGEAKFERWREKHGLKLVEFVRCVRAFERSSEVWTNIAEVEERVGSEEGLKNLTVGAVNTEQSDELAGGVIEGGLDAAKQQAIISVADITGRDKNIITPFSIHARKMAAGRCPIQSSKHPFK